MRKIVYGIILWMVLWGVQVKAQVPQKEEYEKKMLISFTGDSLNYRLLRPQNASSGKYPLVLFLHGAGERGNDNEKQLTHGGQMFLNPVNREKYPAFVLIPQCPEDKYWAYSSRPASFKPVEMPVGKEITPLISMLKELLDLYIDMPEVDKDRVYIIGLSMGGMAAFDMAIRFPETFAAAIPICGTVHPSCLEAAKDVAFRIYHGDTDNVVTVEGSRQAYKTLKECGANVEYIEFPGCNHGSWTPAFNYPGFMDWLFSQRKKANDLTRMVVLPDTQTYLEQCPEVFTSQIDWILDNRSMVDVVIQVGDLTQENYPAEWAFIKKEFDRLDQAGIPYSIALGNHDMGSRPMKCSDVYNTTLANKYFPLAERQQQNYWGESADGKTIDCNYIRLSSADAEWVVISLPFGASDRELEWAGRVADKYPESYVILNTHAYLYSDSTLLDGKDYWCPRNYAFANDSTRGAANNGDGIWEKFVSQHRNIIAVFCGHVLKSGVGTLVSEGIAGNKVYQMLANFQRGVTDSKFGGEGYLRLVTFDRKKNEIDVQTYSTWNKQYHPSIHHNFKFCDVDFKQYLR